MIHYVSYSILLETLIGVAFLPGHTWPTGLLEGGDMRIEKYPQVSW
jgi:hypothetical protein